MRQILAVLLLGAAAAAPLAAQSARARAVPARPALAAADSNDAAAFYSHGLAMLHRQPAEAADAFYWAARLRPEWADAHYAQRIAILLSDKNRLVDYMEGSRRVVRSPEMVYADSLIDRALLLDPYLYRKYDKQLLTDYFQASAERSIRREGGQPDAAAIAHWIQGWIISAPAWMRAWSAYSEGRFPEAVEHYARAVRQARRDKWSVRADRARTLYLMGADSAALADMSLAVSEYREDDDDDVVFLYESKAQLEHSIGLIHERMRNPAAAREAYGRALQEDLSYHPSHVRLSVLALADGDTATALAEMDLAVQIRATDPALRNAYGLTLASARKYMEAVEQFRKATELDPVYAQPYLYLGRIHDGSGMAESAVEFYEAFLARAAQRDPALAVTTQRLALLREQLRAEAAGTAPAAAPAATPAEGQP